MFALSERILIKDPQAHYKDIIDRWSTLLINFIDVSEDVKLGNVH